MSMRAIRQPFTFREYAVVTTGPTYSMVNVPGVDIKQTSGAAITVTLPPSPTQGQWAFVKDGKGDAATNNITVQGAASATIDGATSHVIALNYGCAIYRYNGSEWGLVSLMTSLASGLRLVAFKDNISAAGSTQATGTPLTAQINTVSTVTAGQGVNLPASVPGLQVTIIHTGANPLTVYPAQGATDTINGVAAANGVVLYVGAIAIFNCTAAGVWTVQPDSTKSAAFNSNAATSGTTLTAANITGGLATVDLAMTGALGGAANAQLPTVAAMVVALHGVTVGTSFRLRIINQSSGNFAWTVTTNTGWTLTGTMSIAQNTWREFVVTINSLTTATLQSVATGTYS